jgi:type I restriction enzyme S subunit
MSTEENTKFVPQLRFPEFLGAPRWTPKELGDCLDYLQPTQFLVSSTSYSDNYQTPVVTAGKTFILGYTNETDGVFKHPLPVIIFDDFTTASQFVNFPFKAKSSAMKILSAKKNSNIKFIYESMQGIEYEVGAHGRHWISAYSKIVLAVPELIEQQKIADCLSSLDELIAAQARKVEALKTHKKGLMQQLFPREGETQPRLRFPEFQNTGDWGEQSVGDFGKVVTGNTPSTAQPAFYGGGIPFASPADISDLRFIDQTKTTLTPEGFAETRPIRAGSVLFVCIGSTIGKVAQNVRDCATNQQINSVVPSSKHSDNFVYFALSYASERIALLAGRQAVPIINKSLFSSVQLLVPKLAEQKRIADCLSTLEDLIAAATQEFDALKTHKKGLMQQLFPNMESSA